jgi:hypothetical protein
MNLQEFKSEFRLMHGNLDIWGDCMDAWFECAGHMYKRNLDIPYEWNYRPGLGSDGTDKESYWYELFESSKDSDLLEIGNLLFRLASILESQGMSY